MKSKKLVSIIVPVYNAEIYLANCIDSIRSQSYRDIELILVNDGSTDQSGELCEGYAQIDERVKVVHQANSGPSAARNKGIAAATGDFIQFVDSDDFIESDMTEELVKTMGDRNQLVLCGYKKILKRDGVVISSKVFSIAKAGEYELEEFLKHFGELYQDYYIHFNWNKLYSRAVIKKAALAFDTKVNWGEDLLFNLKYLENCERVSLSPRTPYSYIDSNSSSITSQFRADLFDNMQMMQGTTREFLKRNNAYSGKNKELFEQFYTSRVVTCFWNLFNPKSGLSPQLIKTHLKKIMQDERVTSSLDFFLSGGMDKKLIGTFIKGKSVELLYAYFSVKRFVWQVTVHKEKKWV
ncbi:glycosyltransferase family 2 protein [Planomicrobium sp. CPCC 101110]|uniref:glycosyltransferase family 2 protein n=1 Tax=Planomicrobium sp. CPCC 101110 TaxID=2599619 RepID=UPI0011B5464A|nr:glycosyltransferase family 2 protein [Planomicrobium sp. CPCC 101110]TWT25970.1 glycosyltransferase [Planomicrobium sp. CPCC 101110]